jgi:hypothetical protein
MGEVFRSQKIKYKMAIKLAKLLADITGMLFMR